MAQGDLKNRVRVCTTLDKEVEKRLKEFSKETMIPISKLMDKAIINLLNGGING